MSKFLNEIHASGTLVLILLRDIVLEMQTFKFEKCVPLSTTFA